MTMKYRILLFGLTSVPINLKKRNENDAGGSVSVVKWNPISHDVTKTMLF